VSGRTGTPAPRRQALSNQQGVQGVDQRSSGGQPGKESVCGAVSSSGWCRGSVAEGTACLPLGVARRGIVLFEEDAGSLWSPPTRLRRCRPAAVKDGRSGKSGASPSKSRQPCGPNGAQGGIGGGRDPKECQAEQTERHAGWFRGYVPRLETAARRLSPSVSVAVAPPKIKAPRTSASASAQGDEMG